MLTPALACQPFHLTANEAILFTHLADVKQGGSKLLRGKRLKIFDCLSNPDKADRHAKAMTNGNRHPTFCCSIQLCHDHTRDLDCLFKYFSLDQRILPT